MPKTSLQAGIRASIEFFQAENWIFGFTKDSLRSFPSDPEASSIGGLPGDFSASFLVSENGNNKKYKSLLTKYLFSVNTLLNPLFKYDQ
jgi:hypothetical protein